MDDNDIVKPNGATSSTIYLACGIVRKLSVDRNSVPLINQGFDSSPPPISEGPTSNIFSMIVPNSGKFSARCLRPQFSYLNLHANL